MLNILYKSIVFTTISNTNSFEHFKKKNMKRGFLGLSTEKDKGYTYIIVLCSALWSSIYFGWAMSAMLLTVEWKRDLGIFRNIFSLI